MPNGEQDSGALASLFKEFPNLKIALENEHVDTDDSSVQEAILITAKTFSQFIAQRTDVIAQRLDKLNPRIDSAIELIRERENAFRHRLRLYQALIVGLGLASVSFTLVSGYEKFAESIRLFMHSLRGIFSSGISTPAYAATSLSTNDATSSILPVIIYGIYALLAVGYIGSFIAMIFAKDKKVRSDSFEYLKQITALFIGVASGKLL